MTATHGILVLFVFVLSFAYLSVLSVYNWNATYLSGEWCNLAVPKYPVTVFHILSFSNLV